MLKEYFSFNKRERNGIIILIVLIFAAYGVKYLIRNSVTNNEFDYSVYEKKIADFEKQILKKKNQAKEIEYFYFDPNVLSSDSLKLLGFSSFLANNIIKYRDKGGKFTLPEDMLKIYGIDTSHVISLVPYVKIQQLKSEKYFNLEKIEVRKTPEYRSFNPNKVDQHLLEKMLIPENAQKAWMNYLEKGGKFIASEDLKKIYGISDSLYNLIFPFIELPELEKETTETVFSSISETTEDIIVVDINNSDTTDWKKLSGIGSAYAKRIVNFREKLGGFYSVEQISETYGLPSETYDKIKSQLKINDTTLEKMNINFATTQELSIHPYLSYQDAKNIIKFRARNGSYKETDVLLSEEIIPEEVFIKVKHYLTIK